MIAEGHLLETSPMVDLIEQQTNPQIITQLFLKIATEGDLQEGGLKLIQERSEAKLASMDLRHVEDLHKQLDQLEINRVYMELSQFSQENPEIQHMFNQVLGCFERISHDKQRTLLNYLVFHKNVIESRGKPITRLIEVVKAQVARELLCKFSEQLVQVFGGDPQKITCTLEHRFKKEFDLVGVFNTPSGDPGISEEYIEKAFLLIRASLDRPADLTYCLTNNDHLPEITTFTREIWKEELVLADAGEETIEEKTLRVLSNHTSA